MAGDQLLRGAGIFMFLVALGQHELFIRLQHGEFPDFLQIAAKTAFG